MSNITFIDFPISIVASQYRAYFIGIYVFYYENNHTYNNKSYDTKFEHKHSSKKTKSAQPKPRTKNA